jgi:hypothetical protein
LDGTPARPDSLSALWTRQLAQLLADAKRDVVLFVDSCFSGESLLALNEALTILAEQPLAPGFGMIAACRAFETTGDGAFIEGLLQLMEQGPQDKTAWGPNDETIRLGALVSELKALSLPVKEVLADGASELRILPNLAWDPDEPEGRVHVKLRLRRMSAGAEAHLLDKSEGFVGRLGLRARIADWLATAKQGMFVVTGGPGTGKSALMGLLARQSVGDPHARARGDAPVVKEGTFDVIVHARQKRLEQVQTELASTNKAGRRTILVDALDEAVGGESIGIATHLRTLARFPEIRIIVGTRPSPVVATRIGGPDPLLAELGQAEVVRLEELDSTVRDIRTLLSGALGETPGSPYVGLDTSALVEEVANRTSPSFLFAQAAARWLTGQAEPITKWVDWRDRLSGLGRADALGTLVAADLAARFSERDLTRVRDLLRALAWAEGLGLPRYTIWPELAEALSPTGARYGDPDIAWALNEAGWYLTEAGEDGQTVYRLFHQSLTDYFRAGTPKRDDYE